MGRKRGRVTSSRVQLFIYLFINGSSTFYTERQADHARRTRLEFTRVACVPCCPLRYDLQRRSTRCIPPRSSKNIDQDLFLAYVCNNFGERGGGKPHSRAETEAARHMDGRQSQILQRTTKYQHQMPRFHARNSNLPNADSTRQFCSDERKTSV